MNVKTKVIENLRYFVSKHEEHDVVKYVNGPMWIITDTSKCLDFIHVTYMENVYIHIC